MPAAALFIFTVIDEVLSAPAAAVGKLMVFPLGKVMFGLLLVIVAVMLLKVPLPSLCKVTLRCPVSPASSTPSLSHEVPSSVRPAFLPLSQARADLKRLSRPGRNPFAPQLPSRLRTLWTLWRASRSREFAK